MALTDAEKAKVRYHLGYGTMDSAAAMSFGLPLLAQPLFILERVLNSTTPDTENEVRRITHTMDGIECRLIDALDRLAADSLGDLKLRQNEHDMLEKEYVRWGCRLADALRVPIYPYSQRYREHLLGGPGSIPVRR